MNVGQLSKNLNVLNGTKGSFISLLLNDIISFDSIFRRFIWRRKSLESIKRITLSGQDLDLLLVRYRTGAKISPLELTIDSKVKRNPEKFMAII